MIVHRRAPKPWVFAVDHDAVQFTWRALRAGHLRAEVLAGSSPIAEPLDLELADATSVLASPERARRSDAGAATISGIPAGRLLTLRLSGTALDGTVERLPHADRTAGAPAVPHRHRLRPAPGREVVRPTARSETPSRTPSTRRGAARPVRSMRPRPGASTTSW
ncbi:MAG: hypothetical protein R2701_04325 [Acidimicrobiales bacterium]